MYVYSAILVTCRYFYSKDAHLHIHTHPKCVYIYICIFAKYPPIETVVTNLCHGCVAFLCRQVERAVSLLVVCTNYRVELTMGSNMIDQNLQNKYLLYFENLTVFRKTGSTFTCLFIW